MAEIIVSALIQVVFQKLGDEGLKYVVRAKGIESELNNLGNTLSMIQDFLNDASDKETADKHVKKWLNRLHHLAYDIDDVLDGLATKAMHLEFSSKVRKHISTFKLSKKLHHQLDSFATKLLQLEKEAHFLGLIVKDEKPRSMSSRRNETSLPDSSENIGREAEKMKLLHKLLGDEPCKEKFSVVPIVGMGGVGKTTLARSLFNETQVKDHFKLHVWVCVSDDFDVFKISENIFREMASEHKEFKNLNELQIALSEQLKDKLFLLVLDDIWSEKYADWENLVKPFHSGAAGSKIIVTTRKEGLLKQIGFGHLDKLETLSHDDAMSLLARHSLGVDNFDSHTDLKPHGDCIVENCGCLPLALKVVGRLLRTKTDEHYWQQVLNSKIWQTDDNIVPALRLSYLELSACSKQLFAYCSFFPKDFLFDKRELVLLWVAEGFIKQSTGSMLTEESLGHEYFEELLSRSFFQHAPNDESLFVMHDLLNDLATFVAEDFFLRLNDQKEMKTQLMTGTLAKYRHMSFIREEYVGYQKFEALKSAKSLRTILAVSVGVKESADCFYLSNKILVDLLPKLPMLRVLSLSGFQISEVPECVGRLKHLRYLNLSQTKIKELPENVGNLYNLQSLIVFGCDKLCKFPKSFSKLKNLRHFDIGDTPLLKQMPLGIGELNSLQTLTKIIIVGDDGFMISMLKDLNNLEGKISIEGLENVQNAMHARDTCLSEKRLTEVELAWSDVSDDSQNETLANEVLYELKPCNDALTMLKIVSYQGTKFPNWVGDPSFDKLVLVWIAGCRNCTSLPVLGRLQSLKGLAIEGMKEVKVIGSELLGTGGVAFPSLETLWFEDMPGWGVWSTCNGDVDGVFPCLRELYIVNCPELVDISLEALPSLRDLVIYGCGDGVLRSVVGAASLVTSLVINNIAGLSDEVWRGVMKNLEAVEKVWVDCCNEIRYMWESEEEASKVLVNLRQLEVNGCSELVRLGEKEEEEDCRRSNNLLTSLRTLKLEGCENVKDCGCPGSIERLEIIKCSSIASVSFPTAEGGGGMQKLKTLKIEDCKELVMRGKEEELFGSGENTNNNTQMLLGAVEEIKMCGCNEIRYMWESEEEASKVLVNLRELAVKNCSQFVRLGEKEEEEDCRRSNNLLTSLRVLKLKDCENLKDCRCPGSIETLRIKKCSSIASVSFPTAEGGGGGMQKLKTLIIKECKELVVTVMGKEEEELFGSGENTNNNNTTQMLLEYVHISGWPNLKSMNGLLNSSIHLLTTLYISNCRNMESFPDLELPNLTSLKHLAIVGCASMDGCFPRGHWPPKLTTLSIGGLKKPISEWGPNQNFPTSLVDLTLVGHTREDDEVRNLSIGGTPTPQLPPTSPI